MMKFFCPFLLEGMMYKINSSNNSSLIEILRLKVLSCICSGTATCLSIQQWVAWFMQVGIAVGYLKLGRVSHFWSTFVHGCE